VDTTGGNELRPSDEEVTLPDSEAATPIDPTDPVDPEASGVPEDPSDIDVIGDSVVEVIEGEEAAGERVDADGDAPGDCNGDGPAEASKLAKARSLARFRIDTNWLRSFWGAHSLGRVALLAVLVYALVVGSAYFFMLQPLSTRLHEAREQKSILHDYMVVEEAGAAINAFKDGLMTGDQRLTVMSEVNLMAEGSGVTLIGDPDLLVRRDGSGHFVEYPIRLRMKGTYHEIGEFLSLLERSARFAIVEDVEVRSDVDSRNRDSEATVLLSLAAWEG